MASIPLTQVVAAGCYTLISEGRPVALLAGVMASGTSAGRCAAASLLVRLLASEEGLRELVAAGGVPPLVALLDSAAGPAVHGGGAAAVHAASRLCLAASQWPSGRAALTEAGAPAPLVRRGTTQAPLCLSFIPPPFPLPSTILLCKSLPSHRCSFTRFCPPSFCIPSHPIFCILSLSLSVLPLSLPTSLVLPSPTHALQPPSATPLSPVCRRHIPQAINMPMPSLLPGASGWMDRVRQGRPPPPPSPSFPPAIWRVPQGPQLFARGAYSASSTPATLGLSRPKRPQRRPFMRFQQRVVLSERPLAEWGGSRPSWGSSGVAEGAEAEGIEPLGSRGGSALPGPF